MLIEKLKNVFVQRYILTLVSKKRFFLFECQRYENLTFIIVKTITQFYFNVLFLKKDLLCLTSV